jgi:hypothetical protein
MIAPAFLEELRSRIPVSEIVGRRVQLRRVGREWRGLSPFNKERTPSFFINDAKGFYHDFSSGTRMIQAKLREPKRPNASISTKSQSNWHHTAHSGARPRRQRTEGRSARS